VEIFSPGSSSSIHSYDPGYVSGYPNGVFWVTAPCVISLDDIVTRLGKGTATLQFSDVAVHDWVTVPNSLSNGTQIAGTPRDATMSLKIHWSGVTRRVSGFSDPTNGFQGNYLETGATIEVAVENSDGSFSFTGSGDTSSCFAEIGQEQNGVFFEED